MRLVNFFCHLYLVLDFFLTAQWIQMTCRNPIRRRQRFVANTSRICRKFMRAFRIELNVKGQSILEKMKDVPYLLVANHGSYTDIIILASLENLTFITSVEMGNNPFLGAITRLGGSLYTDRKHPVGLKREIQNFSDTILKGFKVVLFAEGTSTDGRTIKDFRKSLFQVAINAQCPVLPVCIKYKSLDGKEIDDDNRNLIYWYGDMDFAPHFMKLLNRRISAEIEILDPIVQLEGKMRSELSDEVYERIYASYHS